MQSRRDQVEAHTYLLSRLTGALVSADPDAAEPPTRRDSRGIVTGTVVALLAIAVVAGFALFSTRGSTRWKQPQTLILDKSTGSRYLLVEGRLRPVLNLASAKLLLGSRLTTASVKTAALKNVPRGGPLGIVGAPDSLPAADRVNRGAWRVCTTTPVAALTTYPDVRLITDLAGSPATQRFAADQGLLVDVLGDGTYLVWQGEALKLSEPWVADVLGWGGVRPLTVPSAWLQLLATGPTLEPVAVPGQDDPGPRIDGQATTIGQLFHVDDSGRTNPYYLLQRSGLTALTETQYLLASARAGTEKPRSISAGALAVAASTDPVPDDGLPAIPPELQRVQPGRLPCLEYPVRTKPGRTELVWAPVPGDAHPLVEPEADTATGLHPDQAVRVAPGGGFLVQVRPTSPASAPSLLLVNDTGTAFPLGDAETATTLGYDATTAAPLPPGYVALLGHGALLSRSAAR